MRVFSEQEIGAILKRTAELSKEAAGDRSSDAGLSLEEIQALAADAGLDPKLVSRAAAELTAPAAGSNKGKLFGGSLSYSVDSELGVPVDDDAWESMLPRIRAAFDDPGVVSTRNGVLEWTCSGPETKKAQVSIRQTPAGSQLHVYWSNVTAAIPFFIPAFLAFILSFPIVFEELKLGLIGLPILLAVWAVAFFASSFAVSRVRAGKVKKIDSLVQDLTRIALESSVRDAANETTTSPTRASRSVPSPEGESRQDLLDPGLLDAPGDDVKAGGGSRRTRG